MVGILFRIEEDRIFNKFIESQVDGCGSDCDFRRWKVVRIRLGI